jgi:hypothetical protein
MGEQGREEHLNAGILPSELDARYAPSQKILLNHMVMRTRRIRVYIRAATGSGAGDRSAARAAISAGDKKTAPVQECGFSCR